MGVQDSRRVRGAGLQPAVDALPLARTEEFHKSQLRLLPTQDGQAGFPREYFSRGMAPAPQETVAIDKRHRLVAALKQRQAPGLGASALRPPLALPQDLRGKQRALLQAFQTFQA